VLKLHSSRFRDAYMENNMSEQAPQKNPGKCSQLHALWAEASDGELLPRAFAIEMGVAAGFNPATCRTQYQVMFNRARPSEAHAQSEPVEPTLE
jgi:hypothetical protein